MKKINKKGFTLIELLAVVVILLLITLVAIPSIASTIERNKQRINDEKIEVIKSAGGIYASRYKKKFKEITGDECTNNKICNFYDKFLKEGCGISIKKLLEADLITKDELKDSEGNNLKDTESGSTIDNYDNFYVYYEYDEINNEATGKYIIKNSGPECKLN